MRKVQKWQNSGFSRGVEKKSGLSPLFDDMPGPTVQESILKLLAGGQASDMARRAVWYDNDEELDAYMDSEYACDYVQQYNDLLARIRARKKKTPVQDEAVTDASPPSDSAAKRPEQTASDDSIK